jgi:YHS domain-containing protein
MIESRIGRLLYAGCVMVVSIGLGGALSLRGQAKAVFNADAGAALHGYDVVAYFTRNAAVKGQDAFTSRWQGITWRFASAANRDAFAKSPDTYAPQFGGYCAYGVSRGYAVDVDPEAFAVVDSRLYLNYSKKVQATWNQDRDGYITTARANWPQVLSDLQRK